MKTNSIKIEIAVCALVTAAFTNIYITQPILPVLEAEFDVTTAQVSFTVSFVILGIFQGPLAGQISRRYGGGNSLILGSLILGGALGLLLISSVWAVIGGLLNHKLSHSHGRANALYVLFYYAGGWIGITMAGFFFEAMGWSGVVLGVGVFLAVPFVIGIKEQR